MSRNKSTRWTEDQESLLLKLDAEGYPPRLIAAKLERSERSVAVRLAQLKKAGQHPRY
jgi:DNA-directed RNA polymerase specialized sigma24 family protein